MLCLIWLWDFVLFFKRRTNALRRCRLGWLTGSECFEEGRDRLEALLELPLVDFVPSFLSRRRLLLFWLRRSQSRSYACAVCKRLPLGQRPKQLTAAGWAIAGEAALCPDCKDLGWQLPENGGLPFRPSSARQPSS